jgi:hypothetical protein
MTDDRLGAGEPSVESELAIPVRTPAPVTGTDQVDAAITRLGALDELPVADHVAVFDESHRMLQDALADLDGG